MVQRAGLDMSYVKSEVKTEMIIHQRFIVQTVEIWIDRKMEWTDGRMDGRMNRKINFILPR